MVNERKRIALQYGEKFVRYFQALTDDELAWLIDRMQTNQLTAEDRYAIITALTFTHDSIY